MIACDVEDLTYAGTGQNNNVLGLLKQIDCVLNSVVLRQLRSL